MNPINIQQYSVPCIGHVGRVSSFFNRRVHALLYRCMRSPFYSVLCPRQLEVSGSRCFDTRVSVSLHDWANIFRGNGLDFTGVLFAKRPQGRTVMNVAWGCCS